MIDPLGNLKVKRIDILYLLSGSRIPSNQWTSFASGKKWWVAYDTQAMMGIFNIKGSFMG